MSPNQLTFIPWLINEVEQQHHKGLAWHDKANNIIEIPWPRATENMNLEDLGVIYCWHKHRFVDTAEQNRSPSIIKGIFRAILNSRQELTKTYDSITERIIRIQIDMDRRRSSNSMNTVRRRTCSSNSSATSTSSRTNDSGWAVDECFSPSESSPPWASSVLCREVANPSCPVHVIVYSMGMVITSTYCDLVTQPLLITSGEEIIAMDGLSIDAIEQMYGEGAQWATKLFIPMRNVNSEARATLENFQRGLLLKTDKNLNILAQRNSKIRTYVGHSNSGLCRQMSRSTKPSPIYSYISFIEMAGTYKYMLDNGVVANPSDCPTSQTFISVGTEWLPTRAINQLPVCIEIRHERSVLPQQQPQREGGGLCVSLSNSVDRQLHRELFLLGLPSEALQAMGEEFNPYDFDQAINAL